MFSTHTSPHKLTPFLQGTHDFILYPRYVGPMKLQYAIHVGANVADRVSVRTRVPLLPCQRICTDGRMVLTLSRPEATPIMYTVTPGEHKPCVLCGYEVSIRKIWPDNKRERERWVCRGCRYCIVRHLRSLILVAMWGCNGQEARPEENRAGANSLVPDGVAIRFKCVPPHSIQN